jgi:hypothetical protein
VAERKCTMLFDGPHAAKHTRASIQFDFGQAAARPSSGHARRSLNAGAPAFAYALIGLTATVLLMSIGGIGMLVGLLMLPHTR